MIMKTCVPTIIDRINLKGFALQDLKTWICKRGVEKAVLDSCAKRLNELMDNEYAIHFTNGLDRSEHGYYIPKHGLAFGEANEYQELERSWLDKPEGHCFSEEEATDIFVDHQDLFIHIPGFQIGKGAKGIRPVKPEPFFIKCIDGKLDLNARKFLRDQKDAKVIPCCALKKEEFRQGFLSGKFRFDGLGNDFELLNKCLDVIQRYNGYVSVREYDPARIVKMLEKCAQCMEELKNLNPGSFGDQELEKYYASSLQAYPALDMPMTMIVLNAALMGDFHRCQLPVKPLSCLEESGEGHWELQVVSQDGINVKLARKIAARDPHIDLQEDGIVGIDFGTKNTVVSLRGNDNQARLIRVGTSTFDVEQTKADYENPTILEFIDVNTFMEAYASDEAKGRPFTRCKDLKSSHGAKADLAKAGSEELTAFLTDIKQWCGDASGNRIPIIRDKSGRFSQILPIFKTSDMESGFDPLEIYAYYLGLSINNIYNGVFLKYVMAVSTTYEKEIRDKMTKSFVKGIRRSLPEEIAGDEKLMEQFEVKVKWSEPAAYAVCALKEYQLKPAPGEKIFYSVFDFGGGTTDMVFGIWRTADAGVRAEKRYTWVIEQFKEEGDKYLGGENLLELLAYEIFANNASIIGNGQDFSFVRPVDGKETIGLERLVNKSMPAKRNMMNLIEKIRPLWEGIESYGEDKDGEYDKILKDYHLKEGMHIKFLETGYIDIDIEFNNGEVDDAKLYIDSDEKNIHVDLVSILEDRIERGVETYINALKSALLDPRATGFKKAYLLLAGNASKSPILMKLLRKHIGKCKLPDGTLIDIKILSPLGTPQSYEEGAKRYEGRFDKPTGKTGVAYGLLDTTVLVKEETSVDDEAKFKYYLGNNYDDAFVVKIPREVPYNTWHSMGIPADDDMELYYTPLADALGGKMDIRRTKRKICRIKNEDRSIDKDFFVCTRAPDTIEYGIGYISNDGTVDESAIIPIDTVQLLP